MSSETEPGLLALSVHQPWAYLIITGQKTVELRTWETPHRGPLLIHASKSVDRLACEYFGLNGVDLPTGCGLGLVTLTNVFGFMEEDFNQRRFEHRVWGAYRRGLFGFSFNEQRPFEKMLAFAGSQGLFAVSPSIQDQIRSQGVGLQFREGS